VAFAHRGTVPILRSFDADKARAFYCDFLGFTVDWEHRFAPDLPLYMQVSRASLLLHLSEHHGDATPGSAIRIEIAGLTAFHAELTEKRYANARPGIEAPPWGGRSVTVTDPFGNRLVFWEG
jgi:catechol 2,3-dioxygenase-like lactoylglutathione lyase family enzyme